MSTDPDPNFVRPTEQRVHILPLLPIFVWGIVILFFLYFLKAWTLCLMGFLAASCIAAALRPLLRRLPGPRALKGFLLGLLPILICGGLLFIAFWMLSEKVKRELAYLPSAERQFDAWLAGISHKLGLSNSLSASSLFMRLTDSGGGLFSGVIRNSVTIIIGIVFVFIGTIYLLAEPSERAIPPLLALLPPRRRAQTQAFIAALQPRLRWWLIGAMSTAIIVGLTSLLGFWLIGLQLWIPLAILAGLSEFVPTLGPAMAFLLALAIAATQGKTVVVELCGLYVLVHILESYILIPVIYKEAVRIPPIITLFTVILWGEIFGIGGLLLAVPINLFLWTAAENFIGSGKQVKGGEMSND